MLHHDGVYESFKMTNEQLLARVDHVIRVGTDALTKRYDMNGLEMIDGAVYHQFRSAALSVLTAIFGSGHPFYREFDTKITSNRPAVVQSGLGMLRAARDEIAAGWLSSLAQLVTADIFADFLEMAEHLLSENYKDPAAVVIGSVLEEHLRRLAAIRGISTTIEKDGRTLQKKADTLNSELAKAGVYGKLDQKNVTAWLDLRNSAAHGHYTDYTTDQVKLLLQSVADFTGRVSA